jgi:hypothetical protein
MVCRIRGSIVKSCRWAKVKERIRGSIVKSCRWAKVKERGMKEEKRVVSV